MHDLAQLQNRSQQLHDDGAYILNTLPLRQILEHYGALAIVGSFDLNFLIKPDLDLYVKVTNYNVRRHFEIFAEITEALHPLRMKYLDLRVANWPDFPMREGLFIGLSIPLNGIEWSVDGWALTPEIFEERVSYHNEIKRLMTEAMRPILWDIKSQIYKSPDYRSGDLYKAVLKENVTTLTDYYDWYKEQYQKVFVR